MPAINMPSITSIPGFRRSASDEPKWLTLARAEIGVHEGQGAEDNPRVINFYRDAGHPEIRHDSVAWCAAFACAMIERAGFRSPRDLMAKSFLQWGKKLDEPEVGCVVVITRGDPKSIYGHVGFVVGWTDAEIKILGGNQGDQVSIIAVSRNRVLGYRVPATAANSRTLRAVGVGVTSQAIAGVSKLASSSDDVMAFAGELKSSPLIELLPAIGTVASIITLVCLAVVAYARMTDHGDKGR